MADPGLRTLRFGDRTFSYDTGLNYPSGPNKQGGGFAGRLVAREDSVRSTHSEWDSGAGSECSDSAEGEEGEEARRARREEEGGREEEEGDRRIIQPDSGAISRLLNFDEEEEEAGLTSEDEAEGESGQEERRRWRCALVKDLTSTGAARKGGLTRSHSVSLCASPRAAPAPAPRPSAAPPAPALATLDLNLDEVAHIRSVLTRAELEALPLDSGVKEAVEAARLCFLCLTTRFGLFTRGTQCEVCRQTVCSKCCARMRIPVEQFSAVPVAVLAPEQAAPKSFLLEANCAGSAPSSPKPGAGGRPAPPRPGPAHRPLAPPPVTSVYSYGSLHRKAARRWSMISWRGPGGQAGDRERLEGSLLAVCGDCRDMVLQVIRAQGRTRRCRRGQRREECGL